MKGETKILSKEALREVRRKRGQRIRRGAINRERQVRHVFEASGYTVCRAAASKGVADLIAWKAGLPSTHALWISVKMNGTPPAAERLAFARGVPQFCAIIVVWPTGEDPACCRLSFGGELEASDELTEWFAGMVTKWKALSSEPSPSSSPPRP